MADLVKAILWQNLAVIQWVGRFTEIRCNRRKGHDMKPADPIKNTSARNSAIKRLASALATLATIGGARTGEGFHSDASTEYSEKLEGGTGKQTAADHDRT